MLALSIQSHNSLLAYTAIIPISLFFLLDVYYLKQEREFRALYDKVRLQNEDDINYELIPIVSVGILKTAWSGGILLILYAGLCLASIAVGTAISRFDLSSVLEIGFGNSYLEIVCCRTA